MPVTFIQGEPPGYFIHIYITTPIASALKNYYRQNFLEVPTGILNHFWIQVTVSLLKRPLVKANGFILVWESLLYLLLSQLCSPPQILRGSVVPLE